MNNKTYKVVGSLRGAEAYTELNEELRGEKRVILWIDIKGKAYYSLPNVPLELYNKCGRPLGGDIELIIERRKTGDEAIDIVITNDRGYSAGAEHRVNSKGHSTLATEQIEEGVWESKEDRQSIRY